VEQIAGWLEKLGLGQYAKLFSDNDIDVSVLPHLTDEDLKNLAISLGHRRKIFAAINEGFASVQPLAEAERPEEPKAPDTPERRYVTVLFSDLVGSTALSGRLDVEDLRDVVTVYQRCVEETVRRFDGFIAKFLGDGVLVYFGYPEAHEDDPERALRAGLELVGAVKGLQTPELLEARVGIATGLVVVGDAAAGHCGPRHGRYCRQHAQARWQSFCAGRFGREGPEGVCGCRESLGSFESKPSRQSFRCFPRDRSDGACWAARRT
jgi:SAM domain (Sterile alpha motif)/Adenylate and Guanylate cyclase catalytic domain